MELGYADIIIVLYAILGIDIISLFVQMRGAK